MEQNSRGRWWASETSRDEEREQKWEGTARNPKNIARDLRTTGNQYRAVDRKLSESDGIQVTPEYRGKDKIMSRKIISRNIFCNKILKQKPKRMEQKQLKKQNEWKMNEDNFNEVKIKSQAWKRLLFSRQNWKRDPCLEKY